MILIIGGAAEGKSVYAAEHFPGCPVMDDYQDRVRSQLAAGLDPLKEAERLLADSPSDLVVVTNEIGCGLVPVDAEEREWREASGRVNCLLAERASRVIRVVCGVGLVLKEKSETDRPGNEAVPVILIRHGAVPGNLEGRYVGTTDESLLPGEAERIRAGWADIEGQPVRALVTSSLRRTKETAAALFPGVRQTEVPDLDECRFGRFEDRNYKELDGDPDYQRYIDSGGQTAFPGGESRADFTDRCAGAFLRVMDRFADGQAGGPVVFVVHGGTVMAVLERYGRPGRDYFDWRCGNGCGYFAVWDRKRRILTDIRERRLGGT